MVRESFIANGPSPLDAFLPSGENPGLYYSTKISILETVEPILELRSFLSSEENSDGSSEGLKQEAKADYEEVVVVEEVERVVDLD